MHRYSKLSFLAIVVFTCGAAAYAARKGAESDVLAASKARIPLTQAIMAAERHANGKAIRAEYEHASLGWAYAVASGGKVLDVRVDPDSGTVVSSREDKADRDERD
ncbi:PepSY domain-containing protein [Chromobacterium vaccinii]|uniref:PepSY domain-containing protein n=1 Tax=Chromobacterium vaccinii TaxID=1108595 RepID=UPI001E3B8CBD|nr:PepSY domain-containing protein [Chromobacterium vaccinii]MCD4500325.1 PepSY domain-containing protein [Chromobacterium vaccinii]